MTNARYNRSTNISTSLSTITTVFIHYEINGTDKYIQLNDSIFFCSTVSINYCHKW